jgi:hypothetical protein
VDIGGIFSPSSFDHEIGPLHCKPTNVPYFGLAPGLAEGKDIQQLLP